MILNDIKIIGNLVNDPEVRFTPKGTPVANFSLGINETYRVDDEKRQITTFVDVQVWDQAPRISVSLCVKARKSLSKELFVRITGKINKPARTVQSST